MYSMYMYISPINSQLGLSAWDNLSGGTNNNDIWNIGNLKLTYWPDIDYRVNIFLLYAGRMGDILLVVSAD